MKPTFSIATITDLPQIIAIYNQAIPHRQATADLEPINIADRKDWFLSHQPHTRPLWLISLNDTVVGWISLSDFYGRIAYHKTVEISLYLDEQYQGQHLGYSALTFVESELIYYDIDTVLAFVFGHNKPSQKLFEQFGYEKWGHLPHVAELDGVKKDLDIFGKTYTKKSS